MFESVSLLLILNAVYLEKKFPGLNRIIYTYSNFEAHKYQRSEKHV